MTKRALITGVTGQDGAYLAQLLLSIGYEVYGGYRRSSTPNTWRLDRLSITNRISLLPLEMTDASSINLVVGLVQPHEVYNLAAQSFVSTSFEQPVYTQRVNYIGTLHLLEALKDKDVRFYQASTSEMFGNLHNGLISEGAQLAPCSPYGISKAAAHHAVKLYRDAYKMFACCGIAFNHESPLRGEVFVTQKIAQYMKGLSYSKLDKPLQLGNLDACRDWGHARDYVKAMYAMLQEERPKDYVLATGKSYSVRDFVNAAAKVIRMTLRWEGTGVNEKAFDADTGELVVEVSEKFYRPCDVNRLKGDSTRACRELKWVPEISFAELVLEMVDY